MHPWPARKSRRLGGQLRLHRHQAHLRLTGPGDHHHLAGHRLISIAGEMGLVVWSSHGIVSWLLRANDFTKACQSASGPKRLSAEPQAFCIIWARSCS